jgi:hypothetical protein
VLFRKQQEKKELDQELRAYLDATIEGHVAAGMDRLSAIRAARGDEEPPTHQPRDVGWETTLESTWRDVLYSLRRLEREGLIKGDGGSPRTTGARSTTRSRRREG